MLALFWRFTSLALALPIMVVYAISQTDVISSVTDKNISKGIFVGCAIALSSIFIAREKHAYFLLIPATYGVIVMLDVVTKGLDVDYLYIAGWVLFGGVILFLDRRELR